ncbi:MAG: hypothetical protein WBF88_04835 [Pusillimonas sp.]
MDYNPAMIRQITDAVPPLEYALQIADALSLHALFLGSQEVAVRSAYARSKPG